MSLRTMENVSVNRETKEPNPPQAPKTWSDMLIGAIPTEVLAIYTGIIGVIVGTIDGDDSNRAMLRWALYAAGIIVVVAWLCQAYVRNLPKDARTRAFPYAETVAASVAFAAWGLIMPGSPLSLELSGDDLTIVSAILTGGAVLLLAFLGVPLQKEVKNATDPKATPTPGVLKKEKAGDNGEGSRVTPAPAVAPHTTGQS